MPASICYTAPVTASTVIGFGSPCQPYDESRRTPAVSAASLSVPPVLVARMGSRKARRFPQGLPGLPTCPSCRHRLEAKAAVYTNRNLWSHHMGTPSRRSAPRIAVINGQPTTTSRDIAETFGKRHDDVLKRIRALDCSDAFRVRNFAETPYTLQQNGETYTEYRITRDGFAFLCMGFTGAKAAAWKEKYIAHFNAMAEKLAKKQQKQPLAVINPAQSAIKQIAATAGQLIGKGLPPVPDGVVFPPEMAAQIEAAAIAQAMQAIPALRSYLQRRCAYHARNSFGWMPELFAHTLATASLADALNYEARRDLSSIASTAQALELMARQASKRIQEAVRA